MILTNFDLRYYILYASMNYQNGKIDSLSQILRFWQNIQSDWTSILNGSSLKVLKRMSSALVSDVSWVLRSSIST